MEEITYKKQDIETIRDNKQSYINFLYKHLEKFGDDLDSITECFGYVLNDPRSGHVFTASQNDNICGLTIILNTDMKKFAPEHFLVYIAVDSQYRGHGIGKKILDLAKSKLSGSICLHVEPDNPAKRLYEREGFTNKYLEMRFEP